jgi:MSHA biogenesis protein MshL
MAIRILTFGLIILLTVACQSTEIRQEATTKSIDDAFKQEAPAESIAEPPPAVVQSLLPPLEIKFPKEEAQPEQRFDISVNDVDAQEFFMGLVMDTPYNMVVHPSVSGTISLTLKNVTLDEVMETARQVYGFEYQVTKTGYLVLPARLQTKIFHIDYLNLMRQGISQTWVSSGQLTQQGADSSGSSSSSGDNTSNRSSSEEDRESLSSSSVRTRTESDFWSELSDALLAIISNSDGGGVVLNPQSGLAIVKAFPDDLRAVEQFLGVMHKNLNRQVILEAKIVEVTLDDGYQSGINWAALADVESKKSILFGQTGGGTYFSSDPNLSEIAGDFGLLDPENLIPVMGTLTSAYGGVFTASAAIGNFSAFIELLESQGSVQVLSSPRVSTVNNQKAVIKVGTDEYFVTEISSTTVTGTATTTTPTVTLTPFFSGIALDVTPHIDERNDVILHIHPSVSEVNDQTKQLTVAGEDLSLPLALSSVRESDSIIRARSGQIVVIGGLMESFSRTENAKVPVLGDLPVLGGAFHHDRQSERKTELVILLRPLVTNSTQDHSDLVEESAGRFRQMQNSISTQGEKHDKAHGIPWTPPPAEY